MCTELYYIKPAVDQERKVESPMLPYKLKTFFCGKGSLCLQKLYLVVNKYFWLCERTTIKYSSTNICSGSLKVEILVKKKKK